MNSTPVTTIESLSKFGPWDDKSGMPKLYSSFLQHESTKLRSVSRMVRMMYHLSLF